VSLCRAWTLPLVVLESTLRAPGRQLVLAARTLGVLYRHRPDVLFVQNPSLVLSLLARLVRPLFRYLLVIDAHNEGVRPFDRTGRAVRKITSGLLRAADFTVVTNDALAEVVRASGGRALVLPDPLPTPPSAARSGDRSDETRRIAVVATFRPDEPIEALMAAAEQLPEFRFEFSGHADRFLRRTGPLPRNVRLTGFLRDEEYWRWLASSSIVCDLTLKPDCVVCGAYEALALAKPMVLSDNPATRKLFGEAAVLTGSASADIAASIQRAFDMRQRLVAGATACRDSYASWWQPMADAVWQCITLEARSQQRASP